MQKRLLLSLLIFAFAPMLSLFAQQAEVVKGELLIRLHDDADAASMQSRLAQAAFDLKLKRQLSPSMQIWQISFDEDKTDRRQIAEALWADPAVTVVQDNHVIKHRLVPNDALYGSQWQYNNSGVNGGIPGADIKAEQAWDITTGGLSPEGDSIVVAVIDDGVEPTHPDMMPNLWVNRHDTAGNGIDDDGNGYIDDHLGWNAYDSNDDIAGGLFGGWHGTPVAGIVGAKGNDSVGVTGVNWDVKLMIVVGGGQESDAIAAYSYILETRKLYNNTNGQMGAYVVSTNASWGVDFGMASAAPLWCAMYDSLGAAGVLNAGATANANTNVDTQGDLPTQCPSDFLIAVTNTDRTDTKVNQAGYGTNSIDLGAPGEGAFTVSTGGGHSGFGGTSGATPHVAGAIGLLYSAPCLELSQLAKSNPDSAAKLVRQFILEGTDSLASLNGITVTGGRLNLYKALLNLQAWCTLDASEEAFEQLDENSTRIFSIYPHPAAEYTQVQLFSPKATPQVLRIYNLVGQEVWSRDLGMVKSGFSEERIELSNFRAGMYVMEIRNPETGNAHSTRLVVTR